MKRHIGRLSNTDQRCVVVFMQIPGREDHALVVSTDNLAPRLEAAVMDVVDSVEGQSDAVLGRVLGRRLLPDTGENLMTVLHNQNLLRAVHVDQVTMYPMPNMPFPLRLIIEQMGGVLPEQEAGQGRDDKFNQHQNNVDARSTEERRAIARNLLIEADLHQQDANRKRAEAYKFAPELNPEKGKKAAVKIDGSVSNVTITEAEAPKKRRAPAKRTATKARTRKAAAK